MSELNAEIKVSFPGKKYSEEAFKTLDQLKSDLENSKFSSNSFTHHIDNLELLAHSYYQIEHLSLDKNSIIIALSGEISASYEILESIYKYCIDNKARKFISYSLNDQVMEYDYLCYVKGSEVSYSEGINSLIDEKLEKAKNKGNLLKVLETLATQGKLREAKFELDDIIADYVKTSDFKSWYIGIKELKSQRNSSGDTLLTAMIKSGNEKESVWLIDNAMHLDPYMCDLDGNTPLELAIKENLQMVIDCYTPRHEKAINIEKSKPEHLVYFDKDKSEKEFIELLFDFSKSSKLTLFASPFTSHYSLSNSPIFNPGVNHFDIYRAYYDKDRILYNVGHYQKCKPELCHTKKELTFEEMLRYLKEYADAQ
ncbi:hypothetical protein [Bacterioplanoides sp. SCSIO 12839]|uniref:hypothetical protein n=1 Tax=Bacterioplanoides sp. SCSIO 12839 TaxID=2829569 RepID=UPI00210622CA|nr:hypothetical protein [Bacterioplanoides sp. SCSIO 12839]UTW49350.1 hypothetical protein KFF03_05450 [Bacterioplanoides sp. SCSIO 12839]